MQLKNLKYILTKKIKVKNLFVGELGYITKSKHKYHANMKNKYKIIFRKLGYDVSDYIGEDILTEQRYFFLHGNTYEKDTIDKAIGSYAIVTYTPLSQFLSLTKKTISVQELIELYNELNNINPKQEREIQKSTEPITDSILKTILETNELVKKSNIDDKLKQKLVQELEELGEYYVEETININSQNNSGLTLENAYSIRINTIKRLTEIEEKITNPELSKVRSLTNQYHQFQKILKEDS